MATQCGHVDMVGLLLERGAGANLQSKNGLTALHLAAQDDRTPIARLLTRYGANIDPQTKVSIPHNLIDRLISISHLIMPLTSVSRWRLSVFGLSIIIIIIIIIIFSVA